MDAEEVKDRLKGIINSIIKDQPEEASKELHDVLAAKMRARISPEEEVVSSGDDDTTDDDNSTADDDTTDDEEVT